MFGKRLSSIHHLWLWFLLAFCCPVSNAFSRISFFKYQTNLRSSVKSNDSLQKVVVTVPRQEDSSKYEEILFQKIPKNTVIRWYAAKISESIAELEVIIEEKGVGNSGVCNSN